MKDASNNYSNDHGFEFVSYLYGELSEVDRSAFETHLANCDECAIELSNYSDARLGVIEWRREDFDHLESPAIIVPWANEIQVSGANQTAGAMSRFFNAIAAFPLFAKAGVGIALAAMAVSIFYFAVTPGTTTPGLAAVNKSEEAPVEPQKAEDQNTGPGLSDVASSESKAEIGKPINSSVRHEHLNRTLVADRTTAPRVRRSELAENETNKTNTAAAKKAPRLTTAEEEDDKTLRLADLFAEIGSSEE